ncbi:hypothetical protein NE237_027159 [Protea cynaroides]|uniref:Uncharacterized protein n=1 Tax=Protea cynaroides TaxID=273540 RepID=A0A9Q0JSX5_9MAGN|nr:hypothetical protein NE237_027159 [Protea cynaroides]
MVTPEDDRDDQEDQEESMSELRTESDWTTGIVGSCLHFMADEGSSLIYLPVGTFSLLQSVHLLVRVLVFAGEGETRRQTYLLKEIPDGRTYLLTLKEIRIKRGLTDEFGAEAMMVYALEKVEKEIKKPLMRSNFDSSFTFDRPPTPEPEPDVRGKQVVVALVASKSPNSQFVGGSSDPHPQTPLVVAAYTTGDLPNDQTLFITLSRGYPITESELWVFFTMNYGDCLENIYMQNMQQQYLQALFALVVVKSIVIMDMILKRAEEEGKTKFVINGKHVWVWNEVEKTMRIIGLWLWLESIGFPNINCLNALNPNTTTINNEEELLFTRRLLNSTAISLSFFIENSAPAILSISKFITDVASRAFDDIIITAMTHRAQLLNFTCQDFKFKTPTTSEYEKLIGQYLGQGS